MSLPVLIQYGQFVAPSAAMNLDIGFVPDKFEMIAERAGGADIVEVIWKKTAGSGKCLSFVGAGTATWTTVGGISPWAPAGTVAEISRWTALTAYAAYQMVVPVSLQSTGVVAGVSNLPLFWCTTAGTTGAVEPTWPAAIGGTVTDGTVVWTQIDPKTWTSMGFSAAQNMLTGASGYNPDGTVSVPAKTGLGVTIPAALMTAGVTYDWFAIGRTPV